jgi:hypothetical protein
VPTHFLAACLDAVQPLLAGLGTYHAGKGCLYVKRLADVDHGALRAVLASAAAQTR